MVRLRQIVTALVASVAVLTVAGCGGAGGPSNTTFVPPPTTGLAGLLETPPAASDPGTSDWARNYTPSTQKYVEHLYAEKARKRVTARLAQQQLQEIAHILWVTDKEIQNDIVLLRFADRSGAAAQFDFLKAANTGTSDQGSYTIDAPGTPVVYYGTKPIQSGFTLVKAYAQVGTYVVEMFVYTPGKIPRTLIDQWLRAQLDRLG